MVKRFVVFCLLSWSLLTVGAEFVIRSKGLGARASTRGGGLISIDGAGHSLAISRPGQVDNFVGRALVVRDGDQLMEDFAKLEFQVLSHKPHEITLSAVGVKTFNWLRLTKTFTMDGDGKALVVTWKLTNLDDRAHAVGFWHKTMLRKHVAPGIANEFFYWHHGEQKTFAHPGDQKGDLWVSRPDKAAVGFAAQEDGEGGVVLMPQKLTTALYFWRSSTECLSTIEWFTREQTLQPLESKEFSARVCFEKDVRKQLTRPDILGRTLIETPGNASLIPGIYDKTVKAKILSGVEGPLCQPRHFMDVAGKRQFNASIRGVRLPADLSCDRLAVYEQANGIALLDRPVPFKVVPLGKGEKRVLLWVPGIHYRGVHFTRFKDGHAWYGKSWDKKFVPQYLGASEFQYRLCFDAAKAAPQADDKLFEDGPNLVWNGGFERKAATIDWPDGYNWSHGVAWRKIYYWDRKDGYEGSRCMRLSKPRDSRFNAVLPLELRLEPGIKYEVSCRVRVENRDRNNCLVYFLDMDETFAPDYAGRLYLLSTRDSMGWKQLSKTIFAKEGKPNGALQFSSDVGQDMWIDDVKVVPEDFTYVRRSPLDREREELVATRYPSLDLIEVLSPEFVTPHVSWLKDPVDELPEILYLPMASGNSCENIQRRQILELSQRMKLRYRYIPLLRKVQQAKNFGMVFGDTLEAYTLMRLDTVKAAPKLLIVQAIDFKHHVKQDFVDRLRSFQKQGTNCLFYNCTHIPESLLGKPVPVPQGIFSTPRFRQVSAGLKAQGFRCYQQGKARVICFRDSESIHYIYNRPFECVPKEVVGQRCPAPFSLDFPYWEYMYLSLIKSLRYLAGVEPAVRVLENQGRGLAVVARQAMTAHLKVLYKDMHRQVEGEKRVAVQLKAGRNALQLPQVPLPGGRHVAEYWLLTPEGKAYDCGALTFDTPERVPLTLTFTPADRVFTRGEAVRCTVSLGTVPSGARLEYRVTDSNGRAVAQGLLKAQTSQVLSFKVLPPHTTLYHLRVWVKVGAETVSSAFEEFSMPAAHKDLTQVEAMMWPEYNSELKVYADLGFTMAIAFFMQDGVSFGRFNAMRSVDIEPLSWGMGGIEYPQARRLAYRGDIVSDPVRNPCFSNPEHWQKVNATIEREVKKQRFRYYGIKHCEIADEAYLGSTVCFSPHCLKDFRQEMRRQYGTLEKLNSSWKSAFASWDEVMPRQLAEVTDKSHLGPWLDHKMFMAQVFARQWVGNTGAALRKHIPAVRVGLSGTQIPGYSYDWVQLMKYIDCLSYYGGVQRKVVHDFASLQFVSGQWLGGYAPAHLDNEFNQKSPLWSDLFLGANMLSNYVVGNSIRGDLVPVQNTLWYAELLQELRRGPGRLVLSSREVLRDVSVLYSQASLFAAIGGVGSSFWHNSQTGCAALLQDLKYSYETLSYEDLELGPPRTKVILLPAVLALSDRAVANLRSFVQDGGTVIADFGVGCYDEHGRRQVHGAAASLFGLDRREAKLAPSSRKLAMATPGTGVAGKLSGEFQLGELSLRTGSASAHARTSDGQIAYVVNRLGRGQAVLLNLPWGGYQAIKLGGVGGETSDTESGSKVFCRQMRGVMEGLLKAAGARHNSRVITRQDGQLLPCQTTLRQDGENYVFGLLNHCLKAPDGKYPMAFDRKFAQDIQVTLPVRGHVYNVRTGQYLGNGETISMGLIPGDGQLFSVLRSKVERVAVEAPDRLQAGQPVTVGFKALGGSGPHVFQLDCIGPDGKVLKAYAENARFASPSGTMTFQTAWNDPRGRWIIRVRDVNTGLTGEHAVELE